jgi:hypothetical protein
MVGTKVSAVRVGYYLPTGVDEGTCPHYELRYGTKDCEKLVSVCWMDCRIVAGFPYLSIVQVKSAGRES